MSTYFNRDLNGKNECVAGGSITNKNSFYKTNKRLLRKLIEPIFTKNLRSLIMLIFKRGRFKIIIKNMKVLSYV